MVLQMFEGVPCSTDSRPRATIFVDQRLRCKGGDYWKHRRRVWERAERERYALHGGSTAAGGRGTQQGGCGVGARSSCVVVFGAKSRWRGTGTVAPDGRLSPRNTRTLEKSHSYRATSLHVPPQLIRPGCSRRFPSGGPARSRPARPGAGRGARINGGAFARARDVLLAYGNYQW